MITKSSKSCVGFPVVSVIAVLATAIVGCGNPRISVGEPTLSPDERTVDISVERLWPGDTPPSYLTHLCVWIDGQVSIVKNAPTIAIRVPRDDQRHPQLSSLLMTAIYSDVEGTAEQLCNQPVCLGAVFNQKDVSRALVSIPESLGPDGLVRRFMLPAPMNPQSMIVMLNVDGAGGGIAVKLDDGEHVCRSNGANAPQDCSFSIPSCGPVQLTARPDPGRRLLDWTATPPNSCYRPGGAVAAGQMIEIVPSKVQSDISDSYCNVQARFTLENASVCLNEAETRGCSTGYGALECRSGLQQCRRDAQGVLRWSSCAPPPTCLAEGTQSSCAVPPYSCPGVKTFHRSSGWGDCYPTMYCECRPGTLSTFSCDVLPSVPAPHGERTCGADYRWPAAKCTPRSEVCGNGLDDDLSGHVDDDPRCHQLVLNFNHIDDDAYVWYNTTDGDNNSKALCHIRGSGSCDLSSIMAGMGAPSTGLFIVKFLNGGCFGSSGEASLVIDGMQVHDYNISSGPLHCGYFYRWLVNLDFANGTHDDYDQKQCLLPTECWF